MNRRMRLASAMIVTLIFSVVVPLAVTAQSKVVFWYRIGASEYEWIRDVVRPKFEAQNPKNAFNYFRMGYASALAWIMLLILLAFTVVQFRGARRWVYYGGA